jgi:hypothetical protein
MSERRGTKPADTRMRAGPNRRIALALLAWIAFLTLVSVAVAWLRN